MKARDFQTFIGAAAGASPIGTLACGKVQRMNNTESGGSGLKPAPQKWRYQSEDRVVVVNRTDFRRVILHIEGFISDLAGDLAGASFSLRSPTGTVVTPFSSEIDPENRTFYIQLHVLAAADHYPIPTGDYELILMTGGQEKYAAFVCEELCYLNNSGRLIHPDDEQILMRTSERIHELELYDRFGRRLTYPGNVFDSTGTPVTAKDRIYTADGAAVFPARPELNVTGDAVYHQFGTEGKRPDDSHGKKPDQVERLIYKPCTADGRTCSVEERFYDKAGKRVIPVWDIYDFYGKRI